MGNKIQTVTQKVSSEASEAVGELFAVGIEPLTGLAVGEEAVTWRTLGRALERRLGRETMTHH